jgi:hypothetical protein
MELPYGEEIFKLELCQAVAIGVKRGKGGGASSTIKTRAAALVGLLRLADVPIPPKHVSIGVFLSHPLASWVQLVLTKVTESRRRVLILSLINLRNYFESCAAIKGTQWEGPEVGELLKSVHRTLHRKDKEKYGSETLSAKQKVSWIDWNKTLLTAENWWDTHPGSLEGIVASLYTMFPPRRLQDYSLMRITSDRERAEKDKSANWIFFSSNATEPAKFFWHVFKTAYAMRSQAYEVDHFAKHPSFAARHQKMTLSGRMKLYISKYKIGNESDWFLSLGTDRPDGRTQNLVKVLNLVFTQSSSMLRHEFTASLDHGKMYFREMKEISRAMAHNLETHLQYRRGGKGSLADRGDDSDDKDEDEEGI